MISDLLTLIFICVPPDLQQLTLPVPEEVLPEQQRCELEWNPSLGQENPEPAQREAGQKLSISQEEEQEQLQGWEFRTTESLFLLPSIKSDFDDGLLQPSNFNLTLTGKNRNDCLAVSTTEQTQSKHDGEVDVISQSTSDSLTPSRHQCSGLKRKRTRKGQVRKAPLRAHTGGEAVQVSRMQGMFQLR